MRLGVKPTLEKHGHRLQAPAQSGLVSYDVIETSRDGDHVNGAHYTPIAERRQVAFFTLAEKIFSGVLTQPGARCDWND